MNIRRREGQVVNTAGSVLLGKHDDETFSIGNHARKGLVLRQVLADLDFGGFALADVPTSIDGGGTPRLRRYVIVFRCGDEISAK